MRHFTTCDASCDASGRRRRAARDAADESGKTREADKYGRLSRGTPPAMPAASAGAWLHALRTADSCGPLSAPERALRRGAERGPQSLVDELTPRSGAAEPRPQGSPWHSNRHPGVGEEARTTIGEAVR